MWYPENKKELKSLLSSYFKEISQDNKTPNQKINGLIVPHAGYIYSGKIAASAYNLLKDKGYTKAIILGPAHYDAYPEPMTSSEDFITPLGKTTNLDSVLNSADILHEHSISNQIPFLQYLGINKILPIMISDIDETKAVNLAKTIINYLDKGTIIIVSTDLSHFWKYDTALKKDISTIDAIESLDNKKLNEGEACGTFPLIVTFQICKILKTIPHLIRYANSGDITGDKNKVVGYASFYF